MRTRRPGFSSSGRSLAISAQPGAALPRATRPRRVCVVLRAFASACGAALLLAADGHAGYGVPRSGELAASAPVAQQIAGGDIHRYEIELSSGQYVSILVAKSDLSLSLSLTDPGGRVLCESISRRFGPLRLTQITKAGGTYRVEVRSLEGDAVRRPYEMRIERVGVATARDRKDQLAATAYAEAERLRNEWTEESLRSAVAEYEKAARLWRAISSPREAAASLAALGETFTILGDYQSALDAYGRARAVSRAANDREGEAHALSQLGHLHAGRDDTPRALAYSRMLRQLLGPFAQTSSPERLRVEAGALNTLGEAQYGQGKLNEALTSFGGALDLWVQAEDRRGQALARLNLGYTSTDSGDLPKAIEHFGQALALWRALDDRRGQAQAQTALGAVNSFLGRWQTALTSYREALRTFSSLGDEQSRAVALNNVGRVYEKLNEPHSALDHYKLSLALNQKNGNHGFEAVTQYYIGRTYRQLGDYERALDFYRQSLALSRRLGKLRVAAYAFNDIGAIYAALGQKQFALEQYEKVLKVYREAGDRRGQAHTLKTIGDIHYSSGNRRQALDCFEQCLSLSREAGDRSGETTALYDIARTEREGGDLDGALSHVVESVEIIETLRSQVASQELRASYFASIHKHYGLYVALLMQMHGREPGRGLAAVAFETSEGARSRSLVETLLAAGDDLSLGADPDLLERERTLRRKLSSKAVYLMHLRNSTLTEAGADQIEREVRELTAEYQEVESLLKIRNPRYASLTQPAPLRLEDVQAELRGDDAVLLEFALGDEKSYLWAVTSDSFDSYELPPRLEIEERARRVYQLLSTRGAGENDDAYWREAAALSRMLLGPAAGRLGGRRLLIVADGALQYIPFEALPLPGDDGSGADAGEPRPLVLEHEVTYLPSASTLVALRREKPPPPAAGRKAVFVMADPVFDADDPRLQSRPAAVTPPAPAGQTPAGLSLYRLPATQAEAEEIVALARGDGDVVTGFAASRSAAQSAELGLYRIIHFATHSIIDSKHPELSGIVLSMIDEQGQEQDGFLQLHDIYGLKLSADLVVLSACNTALGKDVRGEGLVGLTRGFMYAGAPRVVATLWKVDDRASAELMSHFYRALLDEGLSPAEALRASKKAMWEKGPRRSPHYWSAFVLLGEYRHAKGDGGRPRAALMLAAAVAVLAVTVVLLYRRRA
ncbi:MAG: CHAT domain-containing protein [Pyrinomonadaceae bacterium]